MSPSLIYLGAAGLQGLATVAVVPVLTRSLGESGFGRFALALVATQLLGLVLALGVPAAVARAGFSEAGDLRRDDLLDVVGVGIAVVALCSGAALLARPLWQPLLGSAASPRLTAWVTVAGAGLALVQLALAALRASRAPWRYMLVIATSTAGAQGAGAVAAVRAGAVEDYFLAYAIVLVFAGGVGLALAGWPTVITDLRRAVRSCVAYGGAGVLVHNLGILLIAAGDRWVIERVEGSSHVGRYQLAYVVGSVTIVAVAAVNNQWSIDYYATPGAGRAVMLERSSREVLRFALTAIVAVCGLSPMLLPILGGPDVDTSGLTMLTAAVSVAAVPYVLYLTGVHVIFAAGRTAALAAATGGAAVLNLALNAVLVPIFSIGGAAAATIVTYVFWAVLIRRRARLLAPLPSFPPRVLAPIGALGLGVLVLDSVPAVPGAVAGGAIAVLAARSALRQVRSKASW